MGDIFHAHKALLQDASLLEEIKKELRTELVNSEHVIKRVFRRWERRFREMEEETFRQRGDDVADIGRLMLRSLTGIHAHILEEVPKNSVLVARRLLPSDTVFLSRRSTVAVVVEFAGPVSHAALLTRELGIPAVARIPELFNKIRQGDTLLVDGFSGDVTVNPDKKMCEQFRNRIEQCRVTQSRERECCHDPAETRNGVTVEVLANVGNSEDVQHAIGNGADGIGLYRLEQFYMSRKTPPSEQELQEEIGRALRPFKDKPATIRLLDAGGDKEMPFINLPSEPNPFLGRRGIRLLLAYPDLAQAQLSAMLQDPQIGMLVD